MSWFTEPVPQGESTNNGDGQWNACGIVGLSLSWAAAVLCHCTPKEDEVQVNIPLPFERAYGKGPFHCIERAFMSPLSRRAI